MKKKPQITGDTLISEIMDKYPLVVDFLIDEYDFYCLSCIMSDFETLEEGCAQHGIIEDDFIELLAAANELI